MNNIIVTKRNTIDTRKFCCQCLTKEATSILIPKPILVENNNKKIAAPLILGAVCVETILKIPGQRPN